MTYTDRNLKLSDLALTFGEASQRLGSFKAMLITGEHLEEAERAERLAWRNFSDALWGKDSPQSKDASGGVKSAPAAPLGVAAEIDTCGGSIQ